LGTAIFCPSKIGQNNDEKLACLDDIWNYQILSLLKEYFYGQADLLRQVLPSFSTSKAGRHNLPAALKY